MALILLVLKSAVLKLVNAQLESVCECRIHRVYILFNYLLVHLLQLDQLRLELQLDP